MNKADNLKGMEEFFAECIAISKRKNDDYCGASVDADAHKNFRLVEQLGIASTEKGLLVRMADKLARLSSLVGAKDGPQVKDESISDTLRDLANYCALLSNVMRDSK